jgi:Leucine-rich repeat (LRR) protein
MSEVEVYYKKKKYKVKKKGMTFSNLSDFSSELDKAHVVLPDKMWKLEISDKKIRYLSDINGLEQCHHVQYLDLDENDIADMSGMEQFPNLLVLNLRKNKIKEFSHLGQCPKLQVLILTDNEIQKIENLKNQKDLRILFLADNKIDSISGLENLDRLEYLYLGGNPIWKEAKKQYNGSKIGGRIRDVDKIKAYCKNQNSGSSVRGPTPIAPPQVISPPNGSPINNPARNFQPRVSEQPPATMQPKVHFDEKKQIEMIRKMMTVSTKIKLEMMRDALKMDESIFNQKIFDWAANFGFVIDGDYLVINKDTVDEFLTSLDSQFSDWTQKEESKHGKIEEFQFDI